MRIRAGLTLAQHAINACHARLYDRLPCGFNSMEDILQWIAQHNDYSVYSFDMFDTLLRRRIDPPDLIKNLAAEHLSQRLAQHGMQLTAQTIRRQRDVAEEELQAKAVAAGEDAVCCLDDILSEVLKTIGADGMINREETVDYEIGLEKKATELMPGVTSLLAYLKSINGRVICTSETYLSLHQVDTILEYHGLLKYIDKVYISSHIGRSKATGRLFQHIIENERGRIVHIGDNHVLDYRIPKRLGMQALWFHNKAEQQRKTRLRELLDGRNRMDYVNAIIGKSDRDRSTLYQIGHDVLGPALTVFVHAVVEQARKDDIERLFFVARDGYVMKKIYQILETSVYADESLPPGKYLCLSRLAVRSASVNELTGADVAEAFGYMASRKKNITLGDVLGSYGLEPAQFVAIAHCHGLSIDEPLVDPVVDSRIRSLLQDYDFRQAVRTRGLLAREPLREYLASVGFMGKGRIALVDATSEGLTQSLMGQVFSSDKNYPAVYGYYFSLLNKGVKNTGIRRDLSTAAGIVGDWRTDSKADLGASEHLGLLIELFSHPNHGLTTGYKKVNGRILPVFRRTPQETQYHLTSQGLQGILDYARTYGNCYALHKRKSEDLLRDVKRNIRDWVLSPPQTHLKALRGLFLTSDWPQQSRHVLIQDTRIASLTRQMRRLFRRLSL